MRRASTCRRSTISRRWPTVLSQGAADIKKIADAAKPLYASLDDSQKHKFGMLGRMLMPERAQFVMDMIHHHAGRRDDNGAE